jgi:hypothetical protein
VILDHEKTLGDGDYGPSLLVRQTAQRIAWEIMDAVQPLRTVIQRNQVDITKLVNDALRLIPSIQIADVQVSIEQYDMNITITATLVHGTTIRVEVVA